MGLRVPGRHPGLGLMIGVEGTGPRWSNREARLPARPAAAHCGPCPAVVAPLTITKGEMHQGSHPFGA